MICLSQMSAVLAWVASLQAIAMHNIDKDYRLLFWLAALVIAAIALYGFITHDVFEEWDGVMQYYSGLAFYQGEGYIGWASHFWPPIVPLLLAAGNPLFIGKLISLLAGMVVLSGVFLILRELQLSAVAAIVGTLLMASNKYFLFIHLKADNHSLEAAFIVMATWLFLRYQRAFSLKPLMLAALVVALAGLVRYTAYAVALSFVLLILSRRNGQAFWQAALFSVVFVLVSLLWWVPNAVMNGSPLANWEYLNVGSAVYPGGARLWYWHNQLGYSSIWPIFVDFPILYTQNVVGNLIKSLVFIIANATNNHYLSALVLLALAGLRFTGRLSLDYQPRLSLLLFTAFVFILLCANVFIFYEALWPVAVLVYIVCYILLAQPDSLLVKMATVLIAINIVLSLLAVMEYTHSQRTDDKGQLASLFAINAILQDDPDIANKVVMASHPARAYYAQSRWVMFPGADYENACDLIAFNYPEKIKAFVPKIPVNLPTTELQPDYMIVDHRTAKRSVLFDASLDFIKTACSNRFELLFSTSSVRVYRINKTLTQ